MKGFADWMKWGMEGQRKKSEIKSNSEVPDLNNWLSQMEKTKVLFQRESRINFADVEFEKLFS